MPYFDYDLCKAILQRYKRNYPFASENELVAHLTENGIFKNIALEFIAKEDVNDKGKRGKWITVNGAHIFIEDGKTVDESTSDYSKPTDSEKPTTKKPKIIDPVKQMPKLRQHAVNLEHTMGDVIDRLTSSIGNGDISIPNAYHISKQDMYDALNVYTTDEDVDNYDIARARRIMSVIAERNPNNPAIRQLTELNDSVKRYNKTMQTLYENTPSFYRGASVDSLKNWLDSGMLNGEGYDFMSLSMDVESANEFSQGVTFVFDGDSVRSGGYAKVVEYTTDPIPTSMMGANNSLESIDTPVSVTTAHEKEVRLPNDGRSIKVTSVKLTKDAVEELGHSIINRLKQNGINVETE